MRNKLLFRNNITAHENDEYDRNENFKKEVKAAFVLRVIAVLINFAGVSVLFNFMGEEAFGFWVTILSITSWLTLMDIGIGLGLRNNLTIAILNRDYVLAKIYISTAYVELTKIFSLVLFVSIFILPFFNFNSIFNIYSIQNSKLLIVILIVFASICSNFVLSLVNQIMNSVQQSSYTSLAATLSNFLFILSVFLLNFFKKVDIVEVAIMYFITLLISSLIVSFFFFREFPFLRPKWNLYDSKISKSIISVGFNFLIINIGMIVLFSTDNLIISNLFGAKEAATYNIAYKFYSSVSLVAFLIMTPLWSAYTEAYTKGDIGWIRNKLKQQNLLMIVAFCILCFLTYFFEFFVEIWMRRVILIDFKLKIFLMFFVLIHIWTTIYANFLNGVGKTKLQLRTSLFAIFFNVILAILFARYLEMGPAGVVLASIISLSFFSILGPMETYLRVLRNNPE